MSNLRERRRQLLRDEILDAARMLIAEKGYTTMSMDELAVQAGISKPTLYSHFTTKDELVVATAVREMERVITLIEARADGQTPLQRLLTLMRTIIQHHIDENTLGLRPWMPDLLQLLCSRAEALECMCRIDASITSLIREGMACGEIDPTLDPESVGSAFSAQVNALKFAYIRDSNAFNPTSATDTLMTIFERGVRSPL
jgi:AcrR family transcriptional regulator